MTTIYKSYPPDVCNRMNTDCLLYILGFFPHSYGLRLATTLGLQKEYLSTVKRFVFHTFEELDACNALVPKSYYFEHVVFDYYPDAQQLLRMETIIRSQTWSGKKINFSFVWHGMGLLSASSLSHFFECIDVTVISRGVNSGGMGNLNCLFNLLSGNDEETSKKISIRFENGRYTHNSIMMNHPHVWPYVEHIYIGKNTIIDDVCWSQLPRICPNAVIIRHGK